MTQKHPGPTEEPPAGSPSSGSAASGAAAGTGPDCEGHPGVAGELRALALAALDRLEPAVHRMRDERPTPTAPACAGCPVCAVLAVLRGERPELALRMGEQLSELMAVLRTALEEGDPAAAQPDAPPTPEPAPPPSGRRVQRIPIERIAP